jgi:hypothetical protein
MRRRRSWDEPRYLVRGGLLLILASVYNSLLGNFILIVLFSHLGDSNIGVRFMFLALFTVYTLIPILGILSGLLELGSVAVLPLRISCVLNFIIGIPVVLGAVGSRFAWRSGGIYWTLFNKARDMEARDDEEDAIWVYQRLNATRELQRLCVAIPPVPDITGRLKRLFVFRGVVKRDARRPPARPPALRRATFTERLARINSRMESIFMQSERSDPEEIAIDLNQFKTSRPEGKKKGHTHRNLDLCPSCNAPMKAGHCKACERVEAGS